MPQMKQPFHWELTCGHVLPNWLLRTGETGYHCAIFQPTLGRAELLAPISPVGLGPVIEQMHGCRAAAGWLRRAVLFKKLIS